MTRLRASETAYAWPDGLSAESVVSVFRVPAELAGQRLDVFLRGELRRTSRTRAQFIIRSSAYDDRGRRLRSNDRVQNGQLVLLFRPPWDEDPVPTHLAVLYEDEHLLAIDKPANVPVHPTARYHHNTVIKLLKAQRPGEFLALGHRIDRETSGVLLIAKSLASERALKRQLEARKGIEKVYAAITWGRPEGGEDGVEFRLERPLELDPTSPYKVKMRPSNGPDALYAATRFTVERTQCKGDRVYAQIRCALETGRQHQIRVHLASLRAPIVGDNLYGPDDALFGRSVDGKLTDGDRLALELPRHALHAQRLELPHPITAAPLSIESPLPSDLQTFWESI
jgi:23S rRNA pseudouridine1911/1915/1917 synthase